MKRFIATIILVIFVLFTTPLVIFKDVYRVQNPPIKSDSINNVSSIPDHPSEIESWVNSRIEYEYDFGTYGVFWYVPTPEEILEKGKGDCKSRAILLASILEEKGIDYELHMSLFHWWVSYPDKELTRYEVPEASVKEGEDWRFPNVRETLDRMWEVKDEYYSMIWGLMPLWKKLVLVFGLVLIWLPRRYREKINFLAE